MKLSNCSLRRLLTATGIEVVRIYDDRYIILTVNDGSVCGLELRSGDVASFRGEDAVWKFLKDWDVEHISVFRE